MAQVRPKDLPAGTPTTDSALIFDNGSTVQKVTPSGLVNVGAPLASQAQAEAGIDNSTRMSPLRTAQATANRAQSAALGVLGSDTNMGTYTGVTLPDNQSAKQNIQALETAVEQRPTSAILASTAASAGSDLIGFGPNAGYENDTVGKKLQQIVSVADYNPPTDGVADAYPAFAEAYAKAPYGGTIYVPQTGSQGYYLSANPDPRTKPVNWFFDNAVQLSGPGLGDPDNGGGTFASLYTNPWLRVIGEHRTGAFGTVNSPSGGAIIGDSWEWTADSLAGWPLSITGDLTNGSAVITNVPSGLIGFIYKGCRVTSTVTQWGFDGTTTRNLRVLDLDKTARTITVGYDIYGNWSNTPAPYLGPTASGVSFTVHKRQWFAGRYEGLDTGTVDASIPGEVHYEICNPVMNITGAPGAMYEFNLNVYANTSDFCRVLFITGSGDTINDRVLGIDLQRGGVNPYLTAISVRNAVTGLFTNAKYPIAIDTVYNNNRTGANETIGYGIHFNNSPVLAGSLFEGGQLANGRTGISVWRFTDTSPTGRFLDFRSADNVNTLFGVNIDGSFYSFGPSTGNSSTVNAGGAEVNGITLRGGTNIRLGRLKQSSADVAINGYIEAYDASNTLIKIALIA